MLYLNKFLFTIKKNPNIFSAQDYIMRFGLTNTHIKDLKKYALENLLITHSKNEYFLTEEGKKYLNEHPIQKLKIKNTFIAPEINIEYLKEEKTSSVLTRTIRLAARYLLQNEPLKENSLEKALLAEIKNNEKLISQIEEDFLNGKRIFLNEIFEKYMSKGLTKSLFSIFLLDILSKNIERIAIYEKSQFQLIFDPLMFDRMIICPQNFEIQKTEMENEYILKDISKIILNKKSNNILEITKGLYRIIKNLDKYTINTQNMSKKTLRFRNIILNAKDPISLFERDIPKAFEQKCLQDCDRKFLNDLKTSINELKDCTDKLVLDLKKFIFKSFNTHSKEDLFKRFMLIKDYIGEKDLKILYNNITEVNVLDDLWTNRIATFINTYRVPKDWSDEDFANFKIKTKELAIKFSILEATVGTYDYLETKKSKTILDIYSKLQKAEQITILRKLANL